MDDGQETIEDAAVVAQLKAQARRVYVQAVALAVPATAIAMLVPPLR